MTDDAGLLREYATTRSQAAFAEVAGRYTDLVYSAAKRQVAGDAHLAEDVTQAVFIILSQKAKSVPAGRPLSSWLLKVTGYCAANARRQQGRRQSHEQRAGHMARSNDSQSAEWNELSPLLDQGLSKLGRADRDALLLRYFEHKSLREVAASMGTSEEAAQKRVTRAVEKLRRFFRRRGMATLSAATLVVMLEQQAVQAAPAALAATVGSGAAAAPTATAVAKGAIAAMTMHKAAAVAAVVVTVLAVGGGGTNMIRGKGEPPQWIKDRIAATRAATMPATQVSGASVGFPDGTSVTLLGMSDMGESGMGPGIASRLGGFFGGGGGGGGGGGPAPQAEASQWWSADGSAIAPLPTGMARMSVGERPGRRQVRFIFAAEGPAVKGGNVSVQIPGTQGSASSSQIINNRLTQTFIASVPENPARVDIRIGLSKGAWREDASMTPAGRGLPTTKTTGPAMFKSMSEQDGRLVVEYDPSVAYAGQRERRMMVMLTDGKMLPSEGMKSESGSQAESYFRCRRDQVVKVVWQSRAYEWATIRNVALKPSTAATQPAAN